MDCIGSRLHWRGKGRPVPRQQSRSKGSSRPPRNQQQLARRRRRLWAQRCHLRSIPRASLPCLQQQKKRISTTVVAVTARSMRGARQTMVGGAFLHLLHWRLAMEAGGTTARVVLVVAAVEEGTMAVEGRTLCPSRHRLVVAVAVCVLQTHGVCRARAQISNGLGTARLVSRSRRMPRMARTRSRSRSRKGL